MQMTELIPKLGKTDAKLIARDRFLLVMFGFVAYMGLTLRFGLPWLNNVLIENGVLPSEKITRSLVDFYPLIVGYFGYFQSALISGTILGFAILDEKDDNTLKAILVTPIRFSQYLLYRVGLAVVVSFIIIVIMVLTINQSLVPIWQMLLLALGGAFTSPIVLLFYAISAENKVQGFAYGKFVSTASLVVLLAWFVKEPLQWLFGLFPPYWVVKAYWMAFDGQGLWWIPLLIGIALQSAVIYSMIRYFSKSAYK